MGYGRRKREAEITIFLAGDVSRLVPEENAWYDCNEEGARLRRGVGEQRSREVPGVGTSPPPLCPSAPRPLLAAPSLPASACSSA